MKRQLLTYLPLVAVGTLLTGCSSSNTAGSVPTAQLVAQLQSSGGLTGWPNAKLYASAIPGAYNCTPASDSNCVVSINDASANSSGQFALASDAIPGTWQIAFASDANCATGSGGTGQVSAGGQYTFPCGQVNKGFVVFSPASCTVQYDQATGTTSSNCPSTIVGTVSQATFPTSHAMVVGTYDDAGTNEASTNQNADSSTQITVTTPTQIGFDAVVVRDSTTNQVLGAGQFQVIRQLIKCTSRTC